MIFSDQITSKKEREEMMQVNGRGVLKGQKKEKKKGKRVNGGVRKILDEYGLKNGEVQEALKELKEIKELGLTDCSIIPCLGKKPIDHEVGCYNLKVNGEAREKGHLKFFKYPDQDLYFMIHLFFPENFRNAYHRSSKAYYFSKDGNPREILVKGINDFLRKKIGAKAPQLSLNDSKH